MHGVWGFQYKRQFEWLKETRQFLYRKISLAQQKTVLEPGCSTALLTEEISKRIPGIAVGLDRNLHALLAAKKRANSLLLVCGDVYTLPFKKETFDAVIFQFFLLWLSDPIAALQEIKRIVCSPGSITTIAEPDYGGRIDFPQDINYGVSIAEKLQEEGADPFVGRKLEYLFRSVSLKHILWNHSSIPFGIELVKQNTNHEWKFIEHLWKSRIPGKLKKMRDREEQFIKEGKRSYFMPVFYCSGLKD
jgi:ubiquinone/menaquinone biosynthesis C-methylase UbiE